MTASSPDRPYHLTPRPSPYLLACTCTLRDSIFGASWMILGRSKWMWPWLWIWASMALREMSASLGPRGLPCQFSLSSMLGKPFPDHTHTPHPQVIQRQNTHICLIQCNATNGIIHTHTHMHAHLHLSIATHCLLPTLTPTNLSR